jgi:hypothetical protein
MAGKRRLAWAGIAGALLLATPLARAAEDEAVLVLEPGAGALEGGEAPRRGPSLGAAAWWGLDDLLWLTVSGRGGAWLASGGEPASAYGEGFLGLAAALDVVRTVPFAELAVGAIAARGEFAPTVRLGIGADHFLSRTVSLGLVLRVAPVPAELGDVHLAAAVRLGWRLEL